METSSSFLQLTRLYTKLRIFWLVKCFRPVTFEDCMHCTSASLHGSHWPIVQARCREILSHCITWLEPRLITPDSIIRTFLVGCKSHHAWAKLRRNHFIGYQWSGGWTVNATRESANASGCRRVGSIFERIWIARPNRSHCLIGFQWLGGI